MCKIFTEKITSKHVQNMFDCFWERFLGILKKWKFSSFLKLFHVSTLKGALGLSFPKNLPQNKLKTSLDNFRNIFGHFWNSKTFSIFFSNFFQVSISRVPWARKEWAKKQLKSSLDISGNVFRDFESLKVYPFLKFFEFSTLQGALGEIFYRKKHLEACWKHVWTLLGTYLGILKKWKFSSFLKFFPGWTFQGALGNFFWEDYLKTSSKLVWTLLRTFWTFLRNQFFFDFSSNFYKIRSPGCTGQEKFKKITSSKFGHFWKRFSGFWNFENISILLKIFDVSNPPGCTGRNFLPEKIPRSMFKTCLNFSGNVFGQFDKKRQKFFHFSDVFPCFDILGCTGQYFSPENYLKTSSKLVWTLLRTFWTFLRNQFFFRFFFEFLQNSISRLHWARKIRKKYLKQVWTLLEMFFGILELWNLFDFCGFFLSLLCALGTAFSVEKLNQNILKQCFWEHFRTILKVSKFLLFLKFFPSLDPPRCTGDFFSKHNYLKTGSEHVWTILGTVLDTLDIMKFSIFSNLSLTRPSRVKCAKFLPKKLPRNMFKTCLIAFGNVFWAFWKNESFPVFWSYATCRPSRVHWAFLFQKTYLKTSWKLVWTILGTFLDTFEIPKLFRFFFQFFPSFDLQGALGKKRKGEKTTQIKFGHFWKHLPGFWMFESLSIFRNFSNSRPSRVHWAKFFTGKNTSKHVENMFEHFWERIWAFWKNESFPVFWSFSQVGPSRVHWAIFSEKITSKQVRNLFGHF